jgi:predicted O-linked N-acetylglucosamine transferase (SPINDLY family)
MAAQGQLDQAVSAVRAKLRLSPSDPKTLSVLGFLQMQAGDLDAAIGHFERALARHPQAAHAHSNLAGALFQRRRLAEAERHYERALETQPSYLPALSGLLVTKTQLDDIDGALAVAEAGLKWHPGSADLKINQCYALLSAARVEEAALMMSRSAQSDPRKRRLLTALAFAANYLGWPAEDVFQIHRSFGDLTELDRPAPRHARSSDDDWIRVGILSSDLKSHSVAYFLLPALRARPGGFRIVCFSAGRGKPGDPMATALRDASDEWVDIASMDDPSIDRAIRTRSIDVLVELNGHSLGNRLSALDRCPAPVVVTAIGYPNTTGHPAIGWRIVDSTTDPAGSERFCTERLLRIDPCFLCYSPPAEAPMPSLPPHGEAVTFGSFNHAAKIQDETAAAWGRLLSEVPDARLLLKSQTLRSRAASETVLMRLEQHGISRNRVEILPYADTVEEHLALYSRVHVALDTMPYNGTTTTCEALWMGVPVVATVGDRHASRVSASLLRAAGCPELVGSDAASFCGIAARIARDRARLLEYRTGLRRQMTASPLMDAPSYGKRFFGALRDAWDAQGATPSPGGSAT